MSLSGPPYSNKRTAKVLVGIVGDKIEVLAGKTRRLDRRTPAVLGDVEHDAVDVLVFHFRVDARILRQLHEELSTVLLDLLPGRILAVDDEAEVMQSGPIRAALTALRACRKMQQREVHHAVGQRDGVTDRRLDLLQALEPEHALVEGCGLFEVGNLNGDMSELGHGALQGFGGR